MPLPPLLLLLLLLADANDVMMCRAKPLICAARHLLMTRMPIQTTTNCHLMSINLHSLLALPA